MYGQSEHTFFFGCKNQKLFGITIKKLDYKLWHKDVTLYEVSDAKEKSLIGYFAIDLFPRDANMTENTEIKRRCELHRVNAARLIRVAA